MLGLNVIAAWISWWVLSGAISGKIEHSWIFPILVFGFWGIIFTLSVIFVRSRQLIWASFLAGILGYLIFFGLGLSTVGAIIAALLFVFIEYQTKKEIDRGIKVDFYHIVSYALKYFVTAICLVIATAYYFSIRENSAKPSATFLETKTLEAEMDWGLKAAGLFLSDDKEDLVEQIRNNVTVDEFLSKNFVDPQVNENINTAEKIIPGGPAEATAFIGSAAAVQIREEMLAKSKRDLAKQLGVNVIGEQPMKEVLMSYIDKTERSFFEYSGSERFYVPVILAFGLFLTARILGTAVDIFLGFFILGIIKILRKFGVVSLGKEQREVAVIEYSV